MRRRSARQAWREGEDVRDRAAAGAGGHAPRRRPSRDRARDCSRTDGIGLRPRGGPPVPARPTADVVGRHSSKLTGERVPCRVHRPSSHGARPGDVRPHRRGASPHHAAPAAPHRGAARREAAPRGPSTPLQARRGRPQSLSVAGAWARPEPRRDRRRRAVLSPSPLPDSRPPRTASRRPRPRPRPRASIARDPLRGRGRSSRPARAACQRPSTAANPRASSRITARRSRASSRSKPPAAADTRAYSPITSSDEPTAACLAIGGRRPPVGRQVRPRLGPVVVLDGAPHARLVHQFDHFERLLRARGRRRCPGLRRASRRAGSATPSARRASPGCGPVSVLIALTYRGSSMLFIGFIPPPGFAQLRRLRTIGSDRL